MVVAACSALNNRSIVRKWGVDMDSQTARIAELRASGRSWRECAETMTAEGHLTPNGARTWHQTTCRRLAARHDERERANGPQSAICYGRVSTSEQARDGHSLAAQIARGRAYCEARGFSPVATALDRGVSGSVPADQRPGMAAALAQLRSGEKSALVVTSTDRLGRDSADVLALARTARGEGWHLAVIDFGLDTSSPAGALMLGVAATVAQYERELLRERTKAGLAEARRKGKMIGRRPSLP